MILESFSEKQTLKAAEELAKNAVPGSIYCLSGDLGVGKTVFSKGFAAGLGISDYITSPTFSIVNEYNGRIPLYHFDVYRIKDVSEMEDTGYEDYFYGNGVCLIEWAELISDILPCNAVHVYIRKNLEKGENYREIEIINQAQR